MMNMMPQMLAPDYPHLFAHVEVDGFTFQDPQSALDFDFDNDDDAAKDIDDFTSLLATIDDEETARDIDDFGILMNALAKSQEKEADMSDVSLDDLMNDTVSTESSSNVDMETSSEYESDEDEDEVVVPPAVPAAPFNFRAPIDPRCCIQSPVFKTIDSRIPMISLPKMDVAFGQVVPQAVVQTKAIDFSLRSVVSTSPCSPSRSVSSEDSEGGYVHIPEKCWVCKSNKSEERKRVLHRYVEKRYCRNWKRGARYTARSRVASSRVREGGRFVTKCEWVAVDYN